MKIPALKEIKQELESLHASKVMELFLKLIRSRKENKELISYLLFEAHNEAGYIETVKLKIDEDFDELPAATKYLTKKALRKILRSISKYARHMGSKQAEIDLLVYFCKKMKLSGVLQKTTVSLQNMYLQQLKKISSLIELLHEDLRYDYKQVLNDL